MSALSLRDLESLPRMGWVTEASPVVSLPAIAAELGLSNLLIKRDDAIVAFGGGNKIRKLDYLLADANYQGSEHWHASGAMGSGQLLSCGRIARELGKSFTAHVCDQATTPAVLENFGAVQELATKVERYRTRTGMALRRPYLVTKSRWRGQAVIPPGATAPAGNVGFVRAGLELAEQLGRESLPTPERIYVALGSGGTAVGLAIGLALAELDIEVRAISAVEALFVSRARIAAIRRSTLRWLEQRDIAVPARLSPRLIVDTSEVGSGYTRPTDASAKACETFAACGLPLEPTYTGKAMAALLRDAPTLPGATLMFWHTCMAARAPASPPTPSASTARY